LASGEIVADTQPFELHDIRLGDLVPLEMAAHANPRPQLELLTDEQLLDSVRQPRNLDYVVINTRTAKLHDGNGRIIELQRRAQNPMSTVTFDTLIPVEFYTPDLSMFPDLRS
jgi:hypothetical protein